MSRAKRNLLIILSLIIWTILPLISVIAAGGIASAFDCDLHEGSAQPCEIFGFDYGETLYVMAVAGWLMLVTVPTGLIGFCIFVIAVFWESITRRRRIKRERGN